MTTNGSFTIKSAYQSFVKDESTLEDKNWRLIWGNSTPLRVKNFLWLAWKCRLLKNSKRARQGLTDYVSCGVCGAIIESVTHALRDCIIAKEVWLRLLNPDAKNDFFGLDLEE